MDALLRVIKENKLCWYFLDKDLVGVEGLIELHFRSDGQVTIFTSMLTPKHIYFLCGGPRSLEHAQTVVLRLARYKERHPEIF